MASLTKNLKQIDLFGQPIQFCLNKKYFHKSVFGGFLTLVLIGAFLSISVQGFIDLVSRTEISAMSLDIPNVDPPFIDLKHDKFNWAFTFTGDPRVKKLFRFDVILGVYYRDSKGNFIKNKYVRDVEPCTAQHFNPLLMPALNAISANLSTLWCPKINDTYFIEGKFTSLNFSFINIKISKCMNTSTWLCASADEVDKAYKDNANKIYFNFYNLNNLVNLNDFDKAVSIFLEDRMNTLIERRFYKEKNYYLSANSLYTDSSILTTSYQKELDFFTFENNYDEAVLDNTENLGKNDTLYLSVYIRSNFLSMDHKRTFQKFGKFIGFVGGFWSILMLVFGTIAKGYNKRRLLIKISNSLYRFFPGDNYNDPNYKKPGQNEEGWEKHGQKSELKSFNSKKSLSVKPGKKRTTLANLDLSHFLSRVRSYLLSHLGIELYKDLKMILPSFLFSSTDKEIINTQRALLTKSKETILKDMDILHLLSKIKEIDKMKETLFTDDQKVCFEFIPKPIICVNNDNHLRQSRSSLEFHRRNTLNKLELSKHEIKDYLALYKSFFKIKVTKDKTNEIEDRLIRNLEPELLVIFDEEMKKDAQRSDDSVQMSSIQGSIATNEQRLFIKNL